MYRIIFYHQLQNSLTLYIYIGWDYSIIDDRIIFYTCPTSYRADLGKKEKHRTIFSASSTNLIHNAQPAPRPQPDQAQPSSPPASGHDEPPEAHAPLVDVLQWRLLHRLSRRPPPSGWSSVATRAPSTAPRPASRPESTVRLEEGRMTPRLMVEMHENMAAIVRRTVLKLAS
jgi:hypothetical protein